MLEYGLMAFIVVIVAVFAALLCLFVDASDGEL